jgi:hypothetical protein
MLLSTTLPDLFPDRMNNPIAIMWPRPGNPSPVYLTFSGLGDWQRFIAEFDLNPLIPRDMWDKYWRAQKLYYLGWIDYECIKAGELAAMVALELALIDRYGGRGQAKPPRSGGPTMLRSLIAYMVEEDGLTDDRLPTFHKYRGGAIVRNLYETVEEWKARNGPFPPPMNLVERRNRAAHGTPFDSMPVSGLIEVIRDLIEYAYRDFINERRGQRPPKGAGS